MTEPNDDIYSWIEQANATHIREKATKLGIPDHIVETWRQAKPARKEFAQYLRAHPDLVPVATPQLEKPEEALLLPPPAAVTLPEGTPVDNGEKPPRLTSLRDLGKHFPTSGEEAEGSSPTLPEAPTAPALNFVLIGSYRAWQRPSKPFESIEEELAYVRRQYELLIEQAKKWQRQAYQLMEVRQKANELSAELQAANQRLEQVGNDPTALQGVNTDNATLRDQIDRLQQELEQVRKEQPMADPNAKWTCPDDNTENDADAAFCKKCGKARPAPAATAAPAIDVKAIIAEAMEAQRASMQPQIDAQNAEIARLRTELEEARKAPQTQPARRVERTTMTTQEAQDTLIEHGQTPSEVRKMDDATLADKVSDLLGTFVTIEAPTTTVSQTEQLDPVNPDQEAREEIIKALEAKGHNRAILRILTTEKLQELYLKEHGTTTGHETHTETTTHTDEHGHTTTSHTQIEGPRQSTMRKLWEKGKKH